MSKLIALFGLAMVVGTTGIQVVDGGITESHEAYYIGAPIEPISRALPHPTHHRPSQYGQYFNRATLLDQLSDDDLLAELSRRGLTPNIRHAGYRPGPPSGSMEPKLSSHHHYMPHRRPEPEPEPLPEPRLDKSTTESSEPDSYSSEESVSSGVNYDNTPSSTFTSESPLSTSSLKPHTSSSSPKPSIIKKVIHHKKPTTSTSTTSTTTSTTTTTTTPATPTQPPTSEWDPEAFDTISLEDKRLAAARIKAARSDKSGHTKTKFKSASKSTTNEKKTQGESEQEFHDRESQFEADLLAAERLRAAQTAFKAAKKNKQSKSNNANNKPSISSTVSDESTADNL